MDIAAMLHLGSYMYIIKILLIVLNYIILNLYKSHIMLLFYVIFLQITKK